MNSFLKSFSIFTLAIILLLIILTKTDASLYIGIVTWFIFGYFVLLTAAFHYGLLMASKGNAQQFVRYYMGATTFKLLLHLGVIIVYCLLNRNDAVRFIISFSLFYLAFTVFEFTAVRKSFKK